MEIFSFLSRIKIDYQISICDIVQVLVSLFGFFMPVIKKRKVNKLTKDQKDLF